MTSRLIPLTETIEQIVNYLEQLLPLANVHMVDYFTNNVYKSHVPLNIQKEIAEFGNKYIIERLFSNDFRDLPNLNNYVKKSQEFTLKNLEICLNTENLIDNLSLIGCSKPLRLKLDIFMTPKKSHEVDILSYVAAIVKNISGTTHLIDIGDGKGYLSSMLALHHKIPVLGVDVSQMNTDGAAKRVKKLSRVWNSEINKRANDNCSPASKVNYLDKEKTSEHLYKQITQYVDENIDFVGLVSNIFLEKPNGLGLVGLHTCGNLAPTCLRIFTKNKSIQTICNIGCCYHFIKEAFEEVDICIRHNESTKEGFPMSDFLKTKRLKIGRAARMIAAQSMERILEKKELPNEIIFYRALFEIILKTEFKHLQSEEKHVGRFRKKPASFLDYTKKALKRLNLNINMTEVEIQSLLNEYEEREYELYIFFLLRNMLSPIIESLILLDRLLYLQERGFENSFVVQFFDPVVSPRCYGLVAMK